MRLLSVLTIAIVMMQGGICDSLCMTSVQDGTIVSDAEHDAPCHGAATEPGTEEPAAADEGCCGSGEYLTSSQVAWDLLHLEEIPSLDLFLSAYLATQPTSRESQRSRAVLERQLLPRDPSDLRVLHSSFLI